MPLDEAVGLHDDVHGLKADQAVLAAVEIHPGKQEAADNPQRQPPLVLAGNKELPADAGNDDEEFDCVHAGSLFLRACEVLPLENQHTDFENKSSRAKSGRGLNRSGELAHAVHQIAHQRIGLSVSSRNRGIPGTIPRNAAPSRNGGLGYFCLAPGIVAVAATA